MHVDIYINITILQKYSGNGRACASSQYQAVFFLPHGLGTRLEFPSSSKIHNHQASTHTVLEQVWHNNFFSRLGHTKLILCFTDSLGQKHDPLGRQKNKNKSD